MWFDGLQGMRCVLLKFDKRFLKFHILILHLQIFFYFHEISRHISQDPTS